jgi:hypothetical protein
VKTIHTEGAVFNPRKRKELHTVPGESTRERRKREREREKERERERREREREREPIENTGTARRKKTGPPVRREEPRRTTNRNTCTHAEKRRY